MTSGSPKHRERSADSGNVISTVFCGDCGSAIYSQSSARPGIRTTYVGTMDDADQIEVSAHIWVKRRLPWVVLPAHHRIFGEAGGWTAEYSADLSRYKPQAGKAN